MALAPPNAQATIRDVASLAGVSVTTVSRFINQRQRFTAAVEGSIQAAIDQVGYRRNPAARSMATGQSGAVAVLVAGVQNPHTASLLKGLSRVASAAQHDLLFVDLLHSPSALDELQRVMGLQVDGLVIAAPLPAGSDALLARYGRPVVDLARGSARPLRAAPPGPAINGQVTAGAGSDRGQPTTGNDEAAALLLARYLLRSGHRRFSYVASDAEPGNALRLRGLQQALDAAGMPLAVHWAGSATADGGAAAASAVFMADPPPDAVVACNDLVAMGLLSEARVLGVAVPQEVSVAGIENMPFARHLAPPLTSVELHGDALGARAMTELLAALRRQPAPASAALPEPRLVVRESTRQR